MHRSFVLSFRVLVSSVLLSTAACQGQEFHLIEQLGCREVHIEASPENVAIDVVPQTLHFITGSTATEQALVGEVAAFTAAAWAGPWIAREPDPSNELGCPTEYSFVERPVDVNVEVLGRSQPSAVTVSIAPDTGEPAWRWLDENIAVSAELAAALRSDVSLSSLDRVLFGLSGTATRSQYSMTVWGAPGEGTHSVGPFPLERSDP